MPRDEPRVPKEGRAGPLWPGEGQADESIHLLCRLQHLCTGLLSLLPQPRAVGGLLSHYTLPTFSFPQTYTFKSSSTVAKKPKKVDSMIYKTKPRHPSQGATKLDTGRGFGCIWAPQGLLPQARNSLFLGTKVLFDLQFQTFFIWGCGNGSVVNGTCSSYNLSFNVSPHTPCLGYLSFLSVAPHLPILQASGPGCPSS